MPKFGFFSGRQWDLSDRAFLYFNKEKKEVHVTEYLESETIEEALHFYFNDYAVRFKDGQYQGELSSLIEWFLPLFEGDI